MTEKTDDVLNKAICFAVNAHQNQRRKLSGVPYILHPLEAAQIASSMTADEEVIAAVVLHDTVEDCGVTPSQLKEMFGERVTGYVLQETEDKMREISAVDSWMIRKEQSLSALKAAVDRNIKIMWLADKLSNLRSIYVQYQQIGDKLWNCFNEKDKNKHGWYYKKVMEYLSDLSEEPAYKEYAELIVLVFGDGND